MSPSEVLEGEELPFVSTARQDAERRAREAHQRAELARQEADLARSTPGLPRSPRVMPPAEPSTRTKLRTASSLPS